MIKNAGFGQQARFCEIDIARGIGISMVVAYHFFFDLFYFKISDFALQLPVVAIGRLAAIIMIFVSGISLSISLKRWGSKKDAAFHYLKRIIFLFSIAALITISTWIYPHEGFIFFGIIHFLAVSSLLGIALNWNKKMLAFVLLISLPAWVLLQNMQTNDIFLSIIGAKSSIYTLDLFSIFPWIGVFFAGMLLGDKMYGANERKFRMKNEPRNQLLEFMGRNSLAIYLLHQPILLILLIVLLKIKIF
jgi:uncharacterized membrane protein